MNKFYTILVGIGSAIAALFAIFMAGKKSGEKSEELETMQETINAVEKAHKIDVDVDSSSDNDVRERLREFTKKD